MSRCSSQGRKSPTAANFSHPTGVIYGAPNNSAPGTRPLDRCSGTPKIPLRGEAQRPDTKSYLLNVKVLYLGRPPNNGLLSHLPVLAKLYPFEGQGKLICKAIFTSTLTDIRLLFYLHLDAWNPVIRYFHLSVIFPQDRNSQEFSGCRGKCP